MVVIGWPFDSIIVLAIVTGLWLVVIGIFAIVWALQARRESTPLSETLNGTSAAN